jgi:hypothetical protein
MHLLFGKLPLLDYQGTTLGHRHPAADTFALLTDQLAGVERVTRLDTADQPTRYAFQVERAGRGRLLVVWDHRDPFDGEDRPPVPVTLPWPDATASGVDAFGHTRPVVVDQASVRAEVSLTPLFITAA